MSRKKERARKFVSTLLAAVMTGSLLSAGGGGSAVYAEEAVILTDWQETSDIETAFVSHKEETEESAADQIVVEAVSEVESVSQAAAETAFGENAEAQDGGVVSSVEEIFQEQANESGSAEEIQGQAEESGSVEEISQEQAEGSGTAEEAQGQAEKSGIAEEIQGQAEESGSVEEIFQEQADASESQSAYGSEGAGQNGSEENAAETAGAETELADAEAPGAKLESSDAEEPLVELETSDVEETLAELEILSVEEELLEEELLAGSDTQTESSVASVEIAGSMTYYDDLSEAWQAAVEAEGEEEVTVALLKDVTDFSSPLTLGTDVSIVFEGGSYALSGNGSQSEIFFVTAGTLTIQSGTVKNTSKYGIRSTGGKLIIEDGSISGSDKGVAADKGSDVEIRGGTIANTGSSCTGVYVNGGSVSVSGGIIYGTNGGYGINVSNGGTLFFGSDAQVQSDNTGIHISGASSKAEISGGSVTASSGSSTLTYGLYIKEGGQAKLSGGTFSGFYSIYALVVGTGSLLESGYAYYGGSNFNTLISLEDNTYIINNSTCQVKECDHSSKTYEDECDGEYHAVICKGCGQNTLEKHTFTDGVCSVCKAEQNSETIVTVSWTDAEGKTTDKSYTDLMKAWAAAQGKTATVTLKESVELESSKYLSIDDAESDITLKMEDEVTLTGSQSYFVIYVYTGKLTVDGGTIAGYSTNGTANGITISKDTSVVVKNRASIEGNIVGEWGSLTVENSTVTSSSKSGIAMENGSVFLNGGTVSATGTAGVGLIVSGGEAVVSEGASVSGAGAGIKITDGGTVTVSGGSMKTTGDGSTYGIWLVEGSVNMTGGSVTGGTYGMLMQGTLCSAVISGGTIQSTGTATGTAGIKMSNVSAESSLEISQNAVVSGGSYGIWVEDGTTTVSGGLVKANKDAALRRSGDGAGQVILLGGVFQGKSAVADETTGGTIGGLLAEGTAYREVTVENDAVTAEGDWITGEESLGAAQTAAAAVQVKQIPAAITKQPEGLSSVYGEEASLQVGVETADSAKTVSYQWYQAGESGDELLDGEENSILTLSGLETGSYSYYCVVTCDGYALSSETAAVTVESREVQVTVEAADKSYDGGTEAALTWSVDAAALAQGDTLTVSGLTGAFADAGAGAGKTVRVDSSQAAVSGNERGRYRLVYPESVTASITPAVLTVTGATVSDKTEDGAATAAVTAAAFSGLVNGETLVLGTDYTAEGSFAGVQAGSWDVTVTVKLLNGNYTLANSQVTAKGTILPAASDDDGTELTEAEQAAAANQLNAGLKAAVKGNRVNISWGKVSNAEGYEIYAAKSGKTMKLAATVNTNGTLSAKIKKISGAKVSAAGSYKLQVKAYRTVNGEKTYLASSLTVCAAGASNKTYTNVTKVKTAKKSYTLKTGKTAKLSVTVKKQNGKKQLLSKKHAARLRYWSTDTSVATVTSGGKIKAVGKGSCTVYVMAQNGVKTKVKVTVK